MKKKYKIIKFIGIDKALLLHDYKYFLASFADVPYAGPEVLVFPSNENGEVLEWIEVDGGRGFRTLEEFLTSGILE